MWVLRRHKGSETRIMMGKKFGCGKNIGYMNICSYNHMYKSYDNACD